MKDINLLSLDLELNQPSGKIIQVGACVGNLKSGDILDTFLYHIKIDEEISEFISNLTGIKQSDINNGYNLNEVYKKLITFHKSWNCFRNNLTWGSGDNDCLRKELGLDDEIFVFGRRWIDVKTLFVSRCFMKNESHQSGLAKALLRTGLQFKGKKHNAEDDAINTFIIYRELLKEFSCER